MNQQLHRLLEEIDSRLSNYIDQLEDLTPTLEADSDAFIADDVRYLMEDIRGLINEEA